MYLSKYIVYPYVILFHMCYVIIIFTLFNSWVLFHYRFIMQTLCKACMSLSLYINYNRYVHHNSLQSNSVKRLILLWYFVAKSKSQVSYVTMHRVFDKKSAKMTSLQITPEITRKWTSIVIAKINQYHRIAVNLNISCEGFG